MAQLQIPYKPRNVPARPAKRKLEMVLQRYWPSGGLDFPAPVHPNPLLGMAQQHALERGVVGAGVAPNGLGGVFAFDERQRILEAEHVRSVRLTPTGRRNDRRARAQCNYRQALERPGWTTQKIHDDAIFVAGVLVHDEADNCAA